MSRGPLRCYGGRHNAHFVEQPYFLKPQPCNPYIGTQFDATPSTKGRAYRAGFIHKHIHHLYRFRYNLFPAGQVTGHTGTNKTAKHVHWLEVSTIERVKVQLFGEEAIPMAWLSYCVVAFTIFHFYRLATQHADGTMYLATGPFTKKWVQMTRFSEVWPMHKPLPYKYLNRQPEWFMYDGYKEMMKLNIASNDPFIAQLRDEGRLEQVLNPHTTQGIMAYARTGPAINHPTNAMAEDNSSMSVGNFIEAPWGTFAYGGPNQRDVLGLNWRDKYHAALSYVGGYRFPI